MAEEGGEEEKMAKMKKKKNFDINWLKWVGLLLLIPSLILNYSLYQRAKTAEKGLKVIEVFDGDSFVLETKQVVRLYNVNAPELEFCGGEEAKERLRELVLGKTIRLEEAVPDKFGRIVALVYVDNNFINKIMLQEGWGLYEWHKSEELLKVSQEAREARRGIYGPRCYQTENK